MRLSAVTLRQEPERVACNTCHMVMSIAETAAAKRIAEETGLPLQHPYHREQNQRLVRLDNEEAARTATA